MADIDWLSGFGLGGGASTGNITGAVVNMLAVIGRVLIILVPIVLVVWVWWRGRQYPIEACLFQQRGTTTLIGWDKIGRFKSPAGAEKHKFKSLKRRKISIEPIPFGYIYISGKGGHYVFLAESDKGSFIPIKVPIAGLPESLLKFEPIPRKTKFWENVELKEKLAQYSGQKWYVQYLPHISFVILAIFIIFLFMVIGDQLAQVANAAAAAAKALGAAAAPVAPATGAPGW